MRASSKTAAPSGVDLTNIEKTLQASIKLMRRTRREMERMRRKPDRHDAPHNESSS
jgi:hypothetical protein